MLNALLDKDEIPKERVADASYVAKILDMALAWKQYGTLPVAGGYLDQPALIMSDMTAVLNAIAKREENNRELQEVTREFMGMSAHPDVPLPPIPKELRHA
jgi:hypothetical protein